MGGFVRFELVAYLMLLVEIYVFREIVLVGKVEDMGYCLELFSVL